MRWLLVLVLTTALGMAFFTGCDDSGDSDADGDADTDADTDGDADGEGTLRLEEVDVATVASGALGPAMTAAGDRLVVGYGAIDGNPPRFVLRMAVLGEDLVPRSDEMVHGALAGVDDDALIADIRLAPIDDCTVWYAYELVETGAVGETSPAYALAAKYDVCTSPPTLVASSAEAIATSVEGPIPDLPPGTELVNDPTPFSIDTTRYVAIRVWQERALRVYELDEALAAARSWDLDLTGVLSAGFTHQNTIVPHADGAWLIQQSSTEPLDMGGTSNLVLVALDRALTEGVSETLLSSCSNDYETYSVGGTFREGLLYVGYQLGTTEEVRPQFPRFLPRLKVFDPSRAFALVDAVALEGEGTAGERVTMAFAGESLYVTYLVVDPDSSEGDEVRIKRFHWTDAPAGSPEECP